jgi:Arc/MetJ-type ribon-helix-helix transcriptional regulator
MDIHLGPELEEEIRQDSQRGPYQTVDEFVERAVSLLHEQEAWLASHRDEIAGNRRGLERRSPRRAGERQGSAGSYAGEKVCLE